MHELSELGVSGRKIAKSIGLSNATVERYLKMSEDEFDKAVEENKNAKIDYDVYRPAIVEILTKHPEATPSGIRNRLQMQYDNFRYTPKAFNNYIRKVREETGIILPDAKVKNKDDVHHSLRETPPPGYEAEVDFGVKNVKDMYGKTRKIYVFSMVMTFSNLLFGFCSCEPFTTATAIEAHRRAFEFFGGRSKTILYDNDVVFTDGHNYGEPLLRREFESFVDEVGFGVRFCKVKQPGSKGTVEVGIRTLKSFLDARTYCGIDSLNSEMLEWLDRFANANKSLVKGMSAHELFEQESSSLIKVPKYKPEQTIFSVCGNNIVRYKHNVYELPMYKALIGTRIKVIDEGNTLAFLLADTDEFLCRHNKCAEQGRRISLQNREATDGRSSLETLLIRYRGNKDIEELVSKGRLQNPRYIISLCQRILQSGKIIPEEAIMDAVKFVNRQERYTIREFMSYLEYRGFGALTYQFRDRDREHYVKRAAEIREELENE